MRSSCLVAILMVLCLAAVSGQRKPTRAHFLAAAGMVSDAKGLADTSAPRPQGASTLRLSTLQVSFIDVALSATSSRTVTLTNSGDRSVSIYGMAITGTNSRDFVQTHTCGTELAKGASCSIRVTFKPSATGARSALLSIRNSGAVTPQTVSLSGTAVAACMNCLIRLCAVNSSNKLTGYCLEGARGGICHQGYTPTQCPVGASPGKPVSRPCGSFGNFTVDASRTCP